MRPEIIECVRQVFELWPAHVTVERIEGYASLIEEERFEVADVQEACRALGKVWELTLPPPVAKIIDRAHIARRERLARERRAGPPSLPPGPCTSETLEYVRASAELRRRTGRMVTPQEVEEFMA